jgi:hypothetical protein
LRQAPELKVRVVNVVNLMKLQPAISGWKWGLKGPVGTRHLHRGDDV